MAYVVQKPVNIAGRRRKIGEVLQDDEVLGASVIRSGMVVYISDDTAEIPGEGRTEGGHIKVPVVTKDGTAVISVAASGISDALLLLQMSESEAMAAIAGAGDTCMLQIVLACSKSSKIKNAVKARLEELAAEVSEGGE